MANIDNNPRSERFMEHALTRWGALVYRIALNQTRSPFDADDVAQDVFISLLQDATAFTNDEHLKAWLICVTINRCRALHRSAWKRHVDATDAASPAFANLEAPAQALVTSDVWDAVTRLPADMRLIVHLHYFEGYPLEEIARLLSCNPATVRTRLHRARKRLKLDLEQEAARETCEYARVPFPDEQR
ncbi:RNA polymerase sigma factor [Eggerthella guodeyinii]|nr:RNA polymerase sigma factor [Eggerthella guodeyinii]